jgi:urease accessory protein UreE
MTSQDGGTPNRKTKEFVEQVEIAGDQLGTRRVVLRSAEGRELLSLPMNVGVAAGGVVTLAAPLLAAVGAVAALVSHVQLDVVRVDDHTPTVPSPPVPGDVE